MITYNDLKRIKRLKGKIELRVYYNIKDSTFRLIHYSYFNDERKYKHIEIDESILEDLQNRADEIINNSIENLFNNDNCRKVSLTSNDNYQFNDIECKECNSNSGKKIL